MDVTRWQRIEAIFHDVVALPDGPARDARLAALGGDDPALTAEVQALLAEDSRLQSDDAAVDPHLGLRLGSYQVERLIARGGMAAVYEAHRADDQFRQRVAVKIMDLRLSDPALVAQFRAERQILAALEHPALTRLLDGGVTALGEPYLVMEFVDGQPIDRYCDGRGLDLPARLALFATVCEGVSFAHRTLVLHRDLKPSNILVTADGHVKVVDFGTATLLQPDRDSTMSRAPLTPAYASPEQLTGRAVGTASDQYSLGLVLYELLTGARPFGERTSLIASVERAMTDATPTAAHATVTAAAAAARQLSPARLRRQLAGDLGTIVGKALAADPRARYASVQHLADDLARWSDGAPILGRPPSVGYRASRFVRRHWVATGLVATLLAGLLTATAVSFQQAAAARRQAAIATSESAKATQLNRFLTEMLAAADPRGMANPNADGGRAITVRDVLDRASRAMEQQLADAPDVEAELRRTLGRTYVSLGALAEGEAQLSEALALSQRRGDDVDVARTQVSMSLARYARGDFAGSEALVREALAVLRAAGSRAPRDAMLSALTNLGLALTRRNATDPEGLALLREALELSEREHLQRLPTAQFAMNLGVQLMVVGDLAGAGDLFTRALRLVDGVANASMERAWILRGMSELARTRGDYPEAARLGGEAVALAAAALPAGHATTLVFKTTWGRALAYAGELTQAEAVLSDADAGFRTLRPAGHQDLIGPNLGLGVTFRRQGRLDDSERVLREVQAIVAGLPGLASIAANLAGELGLTLRQAGQVAEGDALLRSSHADYQRLLGDGHPYTRLARARLAGATD
jgi:serine/threonine-protein kinase